MPDTPKAYKLNKEASGGGYLQAARYDGGRVYKRAIYTERSGKTRETLQRLQTEISEYRCGGRNRRAPDRRTTSGYVRRRSDTKIFQPGIPQEKIDEI